MFAGSLSTTRGYLSTIRVCLAAMLERTGKARGKGAGGETQCVAYFCGHAAALDCRMRLWLAGESRRLWKNPERLFNTRLQFLHPAFLILLLKRLKQFLTKYAPAARKVVRPAAHSYAT
jgi:hypothetical protein